MGALGSVFLDASAVIYLLEGAPGVRKAVTEVLADLRDRQGDPQLTVSALSLLECRVRPLREGNQAVLARYEDFFSDPGLLLVPLERDVLDRVARLRAEHPLKTPDAIQAASALELGAGIPFVTGDGDFSTIPGLTLYQVTPHT
ncbi:type II toxin-antitoxin system VapC family toxin [Thiohalorhabdus sp. Cl-TMA]|uniref:Ribonuclease VapC n=1 Tax=Thiohalorhabdus methylotrophus TaxID=3242694 RepID=A0ABV4U1A9_9GAMM